MVKYVYEPLGEFVLDKKQKDGVGAYFAHLVDNNKYKKPHFGKKQLEKAKRWSASSS